MLSNSPLSNQPRQTHTAIGTYSKKYLQKFAIVVVVNGKCFFWLFSDPPSITHIIHDRIVNETDVVQLNCTADGSPLPTIRWTRVLDNNSVSKVLQIAGKQEEGLYRCTAENGIGNAAKQDVNITVLCKSNSQSQLTFSYTFLVIQSILTAEGKLTLLRNLCTHLEQVLLIFYIR